MTTDKLTNGILYNPSIGGLSTLTSSNTFSSIESKEVIYTSTVTNPPVLFSIDGQPSDLVIGASTGIISGTAPSWLFNDSNITGVTGTTLVSPSIFNISGDNLVVLIDVGNTGSYNIELLLTSDYTITNITTIELQGGGQYPTASAGDRITFRIGDDNSNAYDIMTLLVNAGGPTIDNIEFTVLPDIWSNALSVYFSQEGDNSITSSMVNFPLARAANGSGASDAWSISFWCQKDGNNPPSGGARAFVSGPDNIVDVSTTPLIQFVLNASGSIVLNYGIEGTNNIAISGSIYPADTNWHHVVITYDGGTTGPDVGSATLYYNRFTFYIDNVAFTESGSVALSGAINGGGYDGNIDASTINVGSNYGSTSLFGNIDEFAVWNKELSVSDVNEIYNSGVPFNLKLFNTLPNNWWRMGDGDTFPILQDNGSSNNDLTMKNMTVANIVSDVP